MSDTASLSGLLETSLKTHHYFYRTRVQSLPCHMTHDIALSQRERWERGGEHDIGHFKRGRGPRLLLVPFERGRGTPHGKCYIVQDKVINANSAFIISMSRLGQMHAQTESRAVFCLGKICNFHFLGGRGEFSKLTILTDPLET